MVKSEEFVYFLKTVLFQFYIEFWCKTPTKALLSCVFLCPGGKHPITQVAQSMLDLCDAKLKEVSVNVINLPFITSYFPSWYT